MIYQVIVSNIAKEKYFSLQSQMSYIKEQTLYCHDIYPFIIKIVDTKKAKLANIFENESSANVAH